MSKLSINRISSNIENDIIVISIEDETSGLTIVEVSVDLENFSRALTGVSYQPCEIKRLQKHMENIGKVRHFVYIPSCVIPSHPIGKLLKQMMEESGMSHSDRTSEQAKALLYDILMKHPDVSPYLKNGYYIHSTGLTNQDRTTKLLKFVTQEELNKLGNEPKVIDIEGL